MAVFQARKVLSQALSQEKCLAQALFLLKQISCSSTFSVRLKHFLGQSLNTGSPEPQERLKVSQNEVWPNLFVFCFFCSANKVLPNGVSPNAVFAKCSSDDEGCHYEAI